MSNSVPLPLQHTFVEEHAARSKVDVATDIAGDLPDLIADERALRQTLLTLLSNAMKFTRAGGHATLRAALVKGSGLRSSSPTPASTFDQTRSNTSSCRSGR
jgi:signal transduction histidine kinase